MIYLVSGETRLFNSDKYQVVDMDTALESIRELKTVQADTETKGLDCHSKALLTIQIGNKDIQVVIDWTTISKEDKLKVKEYFESDRVFIFHNAQFDLSFLYKHNIWPNHILDTMIIEQLIYLGYPSMLSVDDMEGLDLPMYEWDSQKQKYVLRYALNKVAMRRLGIDIDKSVRGKIINVGLTEEVIVYAATDVVYLEDILADQMKTVKAENLERAVQLECEFVKALAYIKFCGVHLDVKKWRDKMADDKARLDKAESALNNYVLSWEKTNIKVVHGHRFCFTYVKDNEVKEITIKRLQEFGFMRLPSEDTKDSECFVKECPTKFTEINYQGNLFTGFDTTPKCLINWSSQQQVIQFLKLFGINLKTFDKKSKREKDSIEKNQLEGQKEFFDIIPLFLEYQKAKKVTTTYGQNWINAINEATGRIHADLHCLGTDTGRVSSGGGESAVNQQNIPHDKVTRACFTAESGNLWLSCDYSG